MQIVYILALSLLFIVMIVEGLCIYEKRQYFHKYRNKIKPICDFTCVFLLCIISVIGCIETVNVNIYFLVIYIAVYFLIKEIYTALIIDRRNKSIQTKLQTYVETKITFNELFKYDFSKKEKEKQTTWWIREYSNANNQKGLGIFLNGERHFFFIATRKVFQQY